jgi:hypothetical protein
MAKLDGSGQSDVNIGSFHQLGTCTICAGKPDPDLPCADVQSPRCQNTEVHASTQQLQLAELGKQLIPGWRMCRLWELIVAWHVCTLGLYLKVAHLHVCAVQWGVPAAACLLQQHGRPDTAPD